MVTVQDIQEKTFERAGKGYNMGQVDEFLDELAADFTTLSKENAALKGKLKVLVQKVEEYRQTEDSMRLALLSAQKMSAQIEAEAREKADATVAEAQDYANRITKDAVDSIANEGAKLEEAKKATDKFFEHMRAVCEKQIEFYDKLSQMRLVGGDEPVQPEAVPVEEPEPVKAVAPAEPAKPVTPAAPAKTAKEIAVEETVRSIEASANEAALEEPAELEVDRDLPEVEDEPTRLFPGGQQQKKKRSFDDFHFDDDI